MIEIVYDSSIAGSLRASGLVKKGNYICIVDLMLDVGFLAPPYDSAYRRDLYNKMYTYQFPCMGRTNDNMRTYFDQSIASIRKMQQRAATGEAIRIWADENAKGRCCTALIGHILTELKGLGPVIIMEPPRFNYQDEDIRFCSGWGHFDACNLAAYLPSMRSASKSELEYHAAEWNRLTAENSSLRTLLCNQIRSVPDDFYDEIILEYISKEPMLEHYTTGGFLKSTGYDVNWLFLSYRIVEMIKQGRIVLVEEREDAHGHIIRTIRKA